MQEAFADLSLELSPRKDDVPSPWPTCLTAVTHHTLLSPLADFISTLSSLREGTMLSLILLLWFRS